MSPNCVTCATDRRLRRKRTRAISRALPTINSSAVVACMRVEPVMAIGPVPMMRVVADLTKEYGVPTWVSLNPLMIDGTGMCGGCRVSVGGETRFACVDGPDFDAHKVDFKLLTKRLEAYHDQERAAMKRFLEDPECRLADSVKEFEYPD